MSPPQPTAPAAPTPVRTRRTMTPDALASTLVAEFGGTPPTEVLWRRSESAGLDMVDVDAAIDLLLRDRNVREETISVPADIVDLRGLESVRMRVKGTYSYIKDGDRNTVGGSEYLLKREPENEHDALAVAVFAIDGRKVGYVSTSRAAMIAPLLDSIRAEAYRVAGVGANESTVKLWVDLPKVDALRRLAGTHTAP